MNDDDDDVHDDATGGDDDFSRYETFRIHTNIHPLV